MAPQGNRRKPQSHQYGYAKTYPLGKVRRGWPEEVDVAAVLAATGDPGEALAVCARRQEGLVRTKQLLELGISYRSASGRHRRHSLHRVHRGVYLVGHATLTPPAELLAAVLAVRGRTVVSTRSAAWAFGLLPRLIPHVEVTTDTWRRPREGIQVHCSPLSDADVCTAGNIPLTSSLRTMLDLAVDLDLGALERALDELRSRQLVTDAALRTIGTRYPGHPGLRRLGSLLRTDVDRGFSRSRAERMLVQLIREAGLERPLLNAQAGGFEVDAHWPRQRLVVEFDGYAFHGDRRAFEQDRRKWALLQTRGYAVLAITWRQLTQEPAWVIARIVELLSARTAGTPTA